MCIANSDSHLHTDSVALSLPFLFHSLLFTPAAGACAWAAGACAWRTLAVLTPQESVYKSRGGVPGRGGRGGGGGGGGVGAARATRTFQGVTERERQRERLLGERLKKRVFGGKTGP